MSQALPSDPILVFDIETVADVDAARRIYPKLADLNDADALSALTAIRTQEAGHDFMRLPLQRIVCISALYIKDGKLSLFSLTADKFSEKEILAKFFRAFTDIETLPQLISWNGSGFDIPVLIYRAMQYDLSAPWLFEEGERIKNMRFDNYVNRFHTRHLDLMDRFSQYGASRREAMDIVASLYGLPGKTDVDGSMVGALVSSGDWQTLSIYCESDVMNTWLIYLRWLRLTGQLSSQDFDAWQQQSYDYLAKYTQADGSPRHQEFIADWSSAPEL
ncbi:Polysaccharide biosynthesis protein WlaX [Psychrobacter nivimaris]|uniref:Polysaccharide biosynthesis protein WlaX n=1 Tax=Psychrobacter nivimaris TaxID=281738 RepID=A0A6N7BXY2_9GAMM|nr:MULTISPECIES: 3'-5' exonuclease [Psychrobacter]KAF0569248.1 Polysaccharide biosynthesis protein WlaX [Psychrobacter nivimaris]GAF56325.1 polysaccharide biosynthesis protein WlaX [Psychrobacter sp. JCM 18901]